MSGARAVEIRLRALRRPASGDRARRRASSPAPRPNHRPFSTVRPVTKPRPRSALRPHRTNQGQAQTSAIARQKHQMCPRADRNSTGVPSDVPSGHSLDIPDDRTRSSAQTASQTAAATAPTRSARAHGCGDRRGVGCQQSARQGPWLGRRGLTFFASSRDARGLADHAANLRRCRVGVCPIPNF